MLYHIFIFLTSRPEIEVTRSAAEEELGEPTQRAEKGGLCFPLLQSQNHSVLAAVCLAHPPRFFLFTGLLNYLWVGEVENHDTVLNSYARVQFIRILH